MAGTAAALVSKPSGLRWLMRYLRPCSYLCASRPSLPRSTSVRSERQDSEISRPPPPAAAAATIEAARQVVHYVDVAGQDANKLPKESGNQDKHHKQQNDEAETDELPKESGNQDKHHKQPKDQAPPPSPPVPPAGSHRGSTAAAAMPS